VQERRDLKPSRAPTHCGCGKLIEKKPSKLVAVALANEMARIAFAILAAGLSIGKFQRGERRPWFEAEARREPWRHRSLG
jgi:hypothetical protein